MSRLPRAVELVLGLLVFSTAPLSGAAPEPGLTAETTQADHADMAAGASQHPLRSDRLLLRSDQFEIEYSTGQDEYVAALRQALADAAPPDTARIEAPASSLAQAPLSAKDCLERRDLILGTIARHLGLDGPTEIQGAGYDYFLGHYATLEIAADFFPLYVNAVFSKPRFAIWDRRDVLRRLKNGETIENFRLDKDTETLRYEVTTNYQLEQPTGEDIQAIERARLSYAFNYRAEKGVATLKASFTRREDGTIPPPPFPGAHQQALRAKALEVAANVEPMVFPVSTHAENGEPVPALEAVRKALAQRSDIRTVSLQQYIGGDLHMHLFTLLHETIEIGVVDHYLGSADRRWFCDGVANYLAWKITGELAGPETARKVYDLEARLQQAAPLRGRVNLAKWKAVEHESSEQTDQDLTVAHYAYATKAVALMHKHGGQDILPRLLRELGKTPREKASLKTVARIYKSLTGHSLEAVLREAQKV